MVKYPNSRRDNHSVQVESVESTCESHETQMNFQSCRNAGTTPARGVADCRRHPLYIISTISLRSFRIATCGFIAFASAGVQSANAITITRSPGSARRAIAPFI